MKETEKKVRLAIRGMTCANCGSVIEKALKGMEGILSAEASFERASADIVYDERKVGLTEIIARIDSLGYTAVAGKKALDPSLGRRALLLAAIPALYALLQSSQVLNVLAPGRLADAGMGYGMLFVIGLMTSLHCVAMCGGINLSQCLPGRVPDSEGSGGLKTFLPALACSAGRVLTYTAAGFFLGLAGLLLGGGAQSGPSALLQGMLKMTAGVLMALMGVSMLGLVPWLRRCSFRTPRLLARKSALWRIRAAGPFLAGILNGFMPCGPLQSMWLVALATGDPLAGALSMLSFGLGTVPLMLGLGSIVSVLGRKWRTCVMNAGAVLVVVLGLSLLSQGGELSGWFSPDLLFVLLAALSAAGLLLSVPAESRVLKWTLRAASLAAVAGSFALWSVYGQPAGASAPAAEGGADGVQLVKSTLSPGRYPDITVRAGVPVTWEIDAPKGSINGCNYRMLIGEYGIEHTFHTGKNVIEFTPVRAGTIRYTCWMGMIPGTILVTDATGSAGAPPVREEGGGTCGCCDPGSPGSCPENGSSPPERG